MSKVIIGRWLSKIESREEALKAVKDTSLVFVVIGGLAAAGAFVLGYGILIDAGLYLGCSFFLWRYKSRAAAVTLLTLACASVTVALMNMAGFQFGGGTNILVALAAIWASIRAVEATFKLHGRFSTNTKIAG